MKKRLHRGGKKKHVLSVMRKIIGASLAESKAVLGLAPDTVKSIQSGRLPFSEHAALIVAKNTGVACKWLLDLDGSKPPKTENGEKFTKETFDKHESERDKDVREWSNPANSDNYRLSCLEQFRTLATTLAGLMLVAHTSRKVGFIDAKLSNEMQRLAKLLRREGVVAEFERRVWEQTENMDAENEAGLVAIFNQFKKELPPARRLDEYLSWPALTLEQVEAVRNRRKSR